jgi:hypothetical protein
VADGLPVFVLREVAMRFWRYGIPIVLAASVGLAASSARAGGDVCFRLWAERNAIYKAHGYCFHTWRAQSYFGNFGCAFWHEYEVPMSPGASARVAYLVDREYAFGCRWSGYWD